MRSALQTLLVAATLIVATVGSAMAAPAIPAVPEPGTFVLFGVGAAGFLLYKKIKK